MSDEVKIKLIFSSAWLKCSDRNKQAKEYVNDFIPQQLYKYGFDVTTITNTCVNEKNLDSEIANSKNFDLILVVPDWITSYYWKKAHDNAAGQYDTSPPHIIYSSALSPHIEHRWSTYVLSTELAHFGLHHAGYGPEVWYNDDMIWNGKQKSYVHQMDDIYKKNRCWYGFQASTCLQMFDAYHTPGGKVIAVHPTYEEQVEEETVVGSGLIRLNIGWLEASYPASGTAVIRIVNNVII